jgi:hypothetical protein
MAACIAITAGFDKFNKIGTFGKFNMMGTSDVSAPPFPLRACA